MKVFEKYLTRDAPLVAIAKHATKILKDGDLVEVDANRGVVRKIKHG